MNNSIQPAFSNYRHTTIPSIKIDQNLSTKIKVSGYYSQTYTYSPNTNGFAEELSPATPQESRAQTIRVNFDDTLTPTLLLHLGVGLLYFDQNQYPPSFDAGQILGWGPNQQYPANNIMPQVAGLSSFFEGGMNLGAGFFAPTPGVGFAADQDEKEYKPTANANLTWVKGKHTFKFGGEMVIEGFPTQSSSRANALYNVSYEETQNPWEYTSLAIGPSSVFTSGIPYASFLLGSMDSLNASAITDIRLGKHELGFFAQDSWKVTRKLSLELGIRWDYSTLLEEEHGRMQSANFGIPNPNLIPADSTTPLNGLVVYQKQYNKNYPFAFGPRLGVAYQIDSKTVFRAGGGIAYATAGGNAGLSGTAADFYALTAPEGTGQGLGGSGAGAIYFRNGNPFAPGNIYGNGPLTAPLSGAAFPSQTSTSGCGPAPFFGSLQTDRFSVHYDRQGHGTSAAHFPMERRTAARNHPQPGGGSQLRRQPRRMVYSAGPEPPGREWTYPRRAAGRAEIREHHGNRRPQPGTAGVAHPTDQQPGCDCGVPRAGESE